MIEPISFTGYNSPLKSEWRKGKFPTVRHGFYGDELTNENISLEHLQPHSKGGKTKLNNLVLASKEKNNIRGSKPIQNFVNKQTIADYLLQFIGIKTKKFNGDDYINGVITTLKDMHIDLTV